MWNSTQQMINIATGEEASKELEKNVKSTKERGQTARDNFIARFAKQSDKYEKKESYFDPIKKETVLTFEKNEEAERSEDSVGRRRRG